MCRNLLNEFFTMPSKDKKIQLVLSDKKTADSYHIHLQGYYDILLHFDGKWNFLTTTSDFDRSTQRLGLRRKKFWVTLHWEE